MDVFYIYIYIYIYICTDRIYSYMKKIQKPMELILKYRY
jgi:hypothetical protein